MPGFPFGSLVQYAFDDNGDLILYLAKIAQHTRNVAKDDKVSITVIEDEKTDIQQAGRVTILGHLRPYEDQKLAADIYVVEDRAPRVYPWVNERDGGILYA